MIAVVDTSAIVSLATLRSEYLDSGLTVRLASIIPHVPDIVDAEFHHALRGLALGGKISPERAIQARALFAEIPIVRFPSRDLMDRVWALRGNLGAYDACFIALAEALDAPLITCDEKQSRASGHQAMVETF